MALAAEAPARLTLVNRSLDKLAGLAARLKTHHPDLAVVLGGDVAGHDLVINATSLGLKPEDPLPLAVEDVDPGALVAEVIMQPEETALLQAARARGLGVHPGRAMLEGQLAEMFAFLTGTSDAA